LIFCWFFKSQQQQARTAPPGIFSSYLYFMKNAEMSKNLLFVFHFSNTRQERATNQVWGRV
jgi:hypothetical protein